MKKSELIENLNFIKNNKLIGKTASLLKTMRIQANSQYLKQFEQKFEFNSLDYFNVDEEFIEYIDADIKKMLPFINSIYKIFNDNGYRHSDVALFSVLYTTNTPNIFKKIPIKISQMEYDILIYLLKNTDYLLKRDIFNKVFTCCISVVDEILTEMNQVSVSDNLIAIYNYYYNVFLKYTQN